MPWWKFPLEHGQNSVGWGAFGNDSGSADLDFWFINPSFPPPFPSQPLISRQHTTMAFEFVENGSIDAKSRKRIRSHVMKGKNTGKTRPRYWRSRFAQQKPSPPEHPVVVNTTFSDGSNGKEVSLCPISYSLGNAFSYFNFPSELQPRMREQIYQCERR